MTFEFRRYFVTDSQFNLSNAYYKRIDKDWITKSDIKTSKPIEWQFDEYCQNGKAVLGVAMQPKAFKKLLFLRNYHTFA